MKQTFRDTKAFVVPFLLWLFAGAVILLTTDKLAFHIWINQWNHSLLDGFFKYATYAGDGFFAAVIILLIFIYRIRFGVVALCGFLGSGLVTQVLKRLVFDDHDRPSKVLENLADLHLVDGVVMHRSFSFPSGHSTAAFSIFFLLCLLSKNRAVQVLCFILSLTVASSRVYLSQHFVQDIYAGSVLGTGISFIAAALFQNKTWGEQGLLDRFDIKRNPAQ